MLCSFRSTEALCLISLFTKSEKEIIEFGVKLEKYMLNVMNINQNVNSTLIEIDIKSGAPMILGELRLCPVNKLF